MLDRREGPRKCSFYKVHSKPVLAVKLSERQVFIENLFLQTLEAFNLPGVELVRGPNTGDIRQSCWQKVEKGSQHRGSWLVELSPPVCMQVPLPGSHFPICMSWQGNCLWVGDKGGNLHLVDTTDDAFEVTAVFSAPCTATNHPPCEL